MYLKRFGSSDAIVPCDLFPFVADFLKCGSCSTIFHELDSFIAHKQQGCTGDGGDEADKEGNVGFCLP